MCGIIGVTLAVNCMGGNAVPLIVEGLKRLEYRGYDSAGVALIECDSGCRLRVYKAKGKVAEVLSRYGIESKRALTGVGHTRWATHGPPSDVNAHPHVDCRGEIAVVHNGIIKNYVRLREELEARGHVFRSETDTEVVAHLLEELVSSGASMLEALGSLMRLLEGSFALAILYLREPNRIYFARRESPLYAAIGECVAAVSSDIPSLLHISKRIVPIEDGEYGFVEPGLVSIYRDGVPVEWSTRVKLVEWSVEEASKAGYPHYMLKEIFEQPRAVYETLMGVLEDPAAVKAVEYMLAARRVYATGAGTSYHAVLVFKHFLQKYAKLPVIDFIASEYGEYVEPMGEDDVLIAVSQSGETTDTLVAVREARKRGVRVIGVTNVLGSTLSRISDITVYTRAGPEIGVAATKTFLAQVTVLTFLAALAGREAGILDDREYSGIVGSLRKARYAAKTGEKLNPYMKMLARLILRSRRSMFVLGRLLGAHLAREAALKIKEIAYVHAEAYPAGESKHGPIALVEPGFPVLFIGTPGVEAKLAANMEEMKARGATVIVVGVDSYSDSPADHRILVGEYDEVASIFALMPPLQLLAYHMAVLQGYDPDKPRNLAKTVTVE